MPRSPRSESLGHFPCQRSLSAIMRVARFGAMAFLPKTFRRVVRIMDFSCEPENWRTTMAKITLMNPPKGADIRLTG